MLTAFSVKSGNLIVLSQFKYAESEYIVCQILEWLEKGQFNPFCTEAYFDLITWL